MAPLRSALFLPASNPRAIAKAPGLACDAVIYDLEDAVSGADKTAARNAACQAVCENASDQTRVIRVNAMDSPWFDDDIEAVRRSSADAVLVPKIRSAADIETLHPLLAPRETAPALWLMIETAEAVLRVPEITAAVALRQNAVLVLGPNDLARETRMRPSPDRREMLAIFTQCLLAARMNGLKLLDGVFNAFRDVEGFTAECAQARNLGFDGKTLIHPSQIDGCNLAFSPTEEELAWAKRVVTAFKEPENANANVVNIDGEMVERLHAQMAREMLATAQTTDVEKG